MSAGIPAIQGLGNWAWNGIGDLCPEARQHLIKPFHDPGLPGAIKPAVLRGFGRTP